MEPIDTVLDARLRHSFWGDLGLAKDAAYKEAANTGSAIITVDAVEIQPRSIRFIGSVPEPVVGGDQHAAFSSSPVRSFHTTWGSVLSPSGVIGYLVVARPLVPRARTTAGREANRVALTVQRTFTTIPVGVLGPVCCAACRLPIPSERLAAVPGVHLCVTCQSLREENTNGRSNGIGR